MTVNQIWIRIIDSILSGAAFSIFACILMFARYRKQNSKGVLFAIAFCIITAGNAFCVAYDLYNNSHVLMTIIGPLASVTKILFALYCWHTVGMRVSSNSTYKILRYDIVVHILYLLIALIRTVLDL